MCLLLPGRTSLSSWLGVAFGPGAQDPKQTLPKVANCHRAQGSGFQQQPGARQGQGEGVSPMSGRGWLCTMVSEVTAVAPRDELGEMAGGHAQESGKWNSPTPAACLWWRRPEATGGRHPPRDSGQRGHGLHLRVSDLTALTPTVLWAWGVRVKHRKRVNVGGGL